MQDLIIYLLVWRNLSYYQYLIETTTVTLTYVLYYYWSTVNGIATFTAMARPLAVELLCLVNGGTKLIGTSNDGHA